GRSRIPRVTCGGLEIPGCHEGMLQRHELQSSLRNVTRGQFSGPSRIPASAFAWRVMDLRFSISPVAQQERKANAVDTSGFLCLHSPGALLCRDDFKQSFLSEQVREVSSVVPGRLEVCCWNASVVFSDRVRRAVCSSASPAWPEVIRKSLRLVPWHGRQGWPRPEFESSEVVPCSGRCRPARGDHQRNPA